MVYKRKIGKANIKFMFRHRFETPKNKSEELLNRMQLWREWKIGVWFKTHNAVGEKNVDMPSEWNKNLVKVYTFGLDLLFVKTWITFDFGAMEF